MNAILFCLTAALLVVSLPTVSSWRKKCHGRRDCVGQARGKSSRNYCAERFQGHWIEEQPKYRTAVRHHYISVYGKKFNYDFYKFNNYDGNTQTLTNDEKLSYIFLNYNMKFRWNETHHCVKVRDDTVRMHPELWKKKTSMLARMEIIRKDYESLVVPNDEREQSIYCFRMNGFDPTQTTVETNSTATLWLKCPNKLRINGILTSPDKAFHAIYGKNEVKVSLTIVLSRDGKSFHQKLTHEVRETTVEDHAIFHKSTENDNSEDSGDDSSEDESSDYEHDRDSRRDHQRDDDYDQD